jgi:hypothetical protein
MRYLCAVVAVVLCCGYNCGVSRSTRLVDKGFDGMKQRLEPDVVHCRDGVSAVMGIDVPNTFLLVNATGEFCLAALDSKGALDIAPVVQGFPGVPCKRYSTNGKSMMAWGYRGRGFYALDISHKKTAHFVVSHDGDEEILDAYLADDSTGRFAIGVAHDGWTWLETRYFFLLFDLTREHVVDTARDQFGGVFILDDDHNLYQRWDYDVAKKTTVYHSTVATSSLTNGLSTPLTELLDERQVHIAPETRSCSPEARMILGSVRHAPTPTGYPILAIAWDDSFADVNAELLSAQIPKDYLVSDRFTFAPDGSWVKTAGFEKIPGPSELIFYHVDDKYPQHLSLPIFGGYSGEDNYGAFVNHTELGPLYVDMDDQHPGVLLVYKLNDALEMLKSAGR